MSLGVVISVVQALILGGAGLAGVEASGESAGLLVFVVAAVGTTLALLGLALVQAATACALVEIDAGGEPNAVDAYRRSFRRRAECRHHAVTQPKG